MDISGTIASVLWTDQSNQAGPADLPRESRESLEDFAAKLVKDERHAREAAFAEMLRLLDWRFVHFAEEFRQQLDGLGLRDASCAKEQRRPTSCHTELGQRPPEQQFGTAPGEQRSSFAEEPLLHLLEGKIAIAEHRIAKVQRWTEAFEERSDCEQSRLAEVEAWLAHLDRRLSDVEHDMGGRRGVPVGSRLTAVERLSAEGRPHEALQVEPNGLSPRFAGGSSVGAFGGENSSMARCRMGFEGLLGKDRPSLCLPSTKVSTNYATSPSQQSLTPSSASALRPYGSR